MCCKAANAAKLVNATLLACDNKKRKGSLEVCFMVGRAGVLQANSVLTGHISKETSCPIRGRFGG